MQYLSQGQLGLLAVWCLANIVQQKPELKVTPNENMCIFYDHMILILEHSPTMMKILRIWRDREQGL